jgi:hypothetical protein
MCSLQRSPDSAPELNWSRHPATNGSVVEAPGFQALSRLLRDKRAYVKLTDA